jgi:hypothetical protein
MQHYLDPFLGKAVVNWPVANLNKHIFTNVQKKDKPSKVLNPTFKVLGDFDAL